MEIVFNHDEWEECEEGEEGCEEIEVDIQVELTEEERVSYIVSNLYFFQFWHFGFVIGTFGDTRTVHQAKLKGKNSNEYMYYYT